LDDANRSPDPVQILRRVIGRSRPGNATDGGATIAKRPVRIVCPAWDSYWYPVRHFYESMSWVGVQEVGPMTRLEAVACLKSTLGDHGEYHTDAELASFAERLHDDPILLGLFGRLLRGAPAVNPLTLSENVIGRMTEQSIGELAAATYGLPADYSGSLDLLSREMIRRKVLYPRWAEVESWFQAEPAIRSRLAQLAAQGHVCRLTEAVAVLRLEFRHDRILEYCLSQTIATVFLKEADDREAITDPFFTPFVGRAIARVNLPDAVLEWIRQRNPAALIAAVPYLTAAESGYADRVVQLARDWLAQPGDCPASMRYDALGTLARSSSSRVLDVTEGMPGNKRVWEARLRNGDALAGAWALSNQFYPAVSYSWLESLLEQAQSHHGSRLTEGIRMLLRSPEFQGPGRFGALCLAGYLGNPELAADVKIAWETARDQREVLQAALWAGFRCAGNSPAELLDPIMPNILSLQHDDSGRSVDERGSVLLDLRFATRHGIGEPVLAYLADLGTTREDFRGIVGAILDDVDHPVAIRYVVRLLAEVKHKAELVGRFSPWALSWGDRWERKETENDNRLSADSVAALRSLWTDEQSTEWLQKSAFSLWARCVDDLSELATIKPENQHYESAVWQRALRGDRSVAGFVLAKLDTAPHWFRLIPHVWGNDFEPAVDTALGRIAAAPDVEARAWSNDSYMMAHLLRNIPSEAAEKLLKKHWAGLSRFARFIQVALYHGTSQCRELAASSLSQAESGIDAFKHIAMFFGFLSQGLRDRLTPRDLDTLLPYLQRLDDPCLGKMLEWCRLFDCWEWAKKHFEPEMRHRVSLAQPGFDGGHSYVVRVTQRWFPADEELVAELDRIEHIDPRFRSGHRSQWWDNFIERSDPHDRARRLLLAWLAQNPSPSRFAAAAELVGTRGKRGDLQALLDLKPAGGDTLANQAVADAEFAVKRRSLD
jgi:hypothetical protein